MLPPLPQRPKAEERRLLRLYSSLEEGDRTTLLAFAEFLAARATPAQQAPLPEPTLLPRPERESVIGAIKRLSAGYPMLDRAQMLNETSSLMAQHVIQGRPAREVIDELEQVFRRHYEATLQAQGSETSS